DKVAVVKPAEPPLPAATPGKHSTVDIAIIVIAVVTAIAAARVAEPFLVPVVVGILLSYTLRPLMSAAERLHVPRFAGAGLVIVLLFSLLSAAAWGLRGEFNAIIAELPGAARKLRLIAEESARDSDSKITRVKAAAEELDRAALAASGKPDTRVSAPNPTGTASQINNFLATQSTNAMVVVSQILVAFLLAFFLLAAGDTFRRKVARLAGASLARRRITVEVLNEIDTQIQSYMLTLLVSNGLIALCTWAGLAMLGVSNAGMWGMVVGLLHIVPYAGTIIAMCAVGAAALLDAGSLSAALKAMTLVLGIATAIGVGFTTWLQGRACRINVVATFVGVLFFGWLWGGWGLLLGMPLLAVLKSIADRVESMQPVRELLSP
ncbi:MAG: AI-2E family transporter, partial [Betaproteobacteria bacterium]